MAPIDLCKWVVMQGDGSNYCNPGWGNGERQFYVPDAVFLMEDNLYLEAKRVAPFTPCLATPDQVCTPPCTSTYEYTSGKVYTDADLAFTYGRAEARVLLPFFQGAWPAVWAMPDTYPAEGVYGTWPLSGEIDVMEHVNFAGFVQQNIHWFDRDAKRPAESAIRVTRDDFGTAYHTYAVERSSSGRILFSVDGVPTGSPTWPPVDPTRPISPYDQPFVMILNLAVGGSFPGFVDPRSFDGGSQRMLVDYVSARDFFHV
ncbi:concanavalin A-like lectin/glucanase domain-containing protein [Tribonema minus]|uniref:Concanavalin A-like lectin/glucanase domain-containing protein n=1 Tax=Tribonema minus TaxID=303371 RepID=A0A836CDT0_9STRA|nr:concanavalin A-like lectin/glucanase domain-containing protein [Tribonema minus]